MRAKGVNYDTGLLSAGASTHEPFDPDIVRREMRVICDAAFLYTFARYDLPHREDPVLDLDRASAGIVKVLDGQSSAPEPDRRRYPDMPWEPKAAFDALAAWYGR